MKLHKPRYIKQVCTRGQGHYKQKMSVITQQACFNLLWMEFNTSVKNEDTTEQIHVLGFLVQSNVTINRKHLSNTSSRSCSFNVLSGHLCGTKSKVI